MILPVVAYGHNMLRKKCEPIDSTYEGLEKLITDMWDTMNQANGVGLAAPQVNRNIRLFIVDSFLVLNTMKKNEREKYASDEGVKQVFINPEILKIEGKEWLYNEGCLSVAKVREDVLRQEKITIRYQDENFETHDKNYNGISARVILHEYDHIEGKLFIDYLSPLKKKLVKRKLDDLLTGKVKTDYKMIFAKK